MTASLLLRAISCVLLGGLSVQGFLCKEECPPPQSCVEKDRGQVAWTYDFGPAFKDLPQAFIPRTRAGCSLVLQAPAGIPRNESDPKYFQQMSAFPYCALAGHPQARPPSSRPPIIYETSLQGDGPWYILEMIKDATKDKQRVFGQKILRLENDRVTSTEFTDTLTTEKLKQIEFSSPYRNGLADLEPEILKPIQDKTLNTHMMLLREKLTFEDGLRRKFVYLKEGPPSEEGVCAIQLVPARRELDAEHV